MKKRLIRLVFLVLIFNIFGYGIGQTDPQTQKTGKVSTLAGGVRVAGFMNGKGTVARFNTPYGIISDRAGKYLYVADTVNQTIRKIDTSTGEVTTLAGKGESFGSNDGAGAEARFLYPQGITIDSTGANLYVADSANHTIRKIVTSSGFVTTVAGSPGQQGTTDATGPSARFNVPTGIVIDKTGTILYVSDKNNNAIRKVMLSSGSVTTLAGGGSPGYSNGMGPGAKFAYPQGIAIDSKSANLYVADTNNQCIRKINIPNKEVTTIAGTAGTFGSNDGTGPDARFFNPQGIVLDSTGEALYVTDTSNHTVRKILLSNGSVNTLTGSPSKSSTKDGDISEALFNSPSGITATGHFIYLMDYAENILRQIS